jgi:vacuolar-type H+-ATPase subunit I/STV1
MMSAAAITRGQHRGEDVTMTIAEGRSPKLLAADRTSVITNSILLTRRIRELQRRRQALVGRQEQVRAELPDWAVEPLRLVGMTNDEIRGLIAELSTAEAEAGLNEIDSDLEDLDRQIEDLENILVATPSDSLDEIEAVIGLTVDRFRDVVVTDPNDLFYDHGEARFLAMLERVQEDLSGLLRRSRLDAG